MLEWVIYRTPSKCVCLLLHPCGCELSKTEMCVCWVSLCPKTRTQETLDVPLKSKWIMILHLQSDSWPPPHHSKPLYSTPPRNFYATMPFLFNGQHVWDPNNSLFPIPVPSPDTLISIFGLKWSTFPMILKLYGCILPYRLCFYVWEVLNPVFLLFISSVSILNHYQSFSLGIS
jgi:hypothetical protein